MVIQLAMGAPDQQLRASGAAGAEILLEGQVIRTVLACDFREDLAKAGLGQGRCSLTFI